MKKTQPQNLSTQYGVFTVFSTRLFRTKKVTNYFYEIMDSEAKDTPEKTVSSKKSSSKSHHSSKSKKKSKKSKSSGKIDSKKDPEEKC